MFMRVICFFCRRVFVGDECYANLAWHMSSHDQDYHLVKPEMRLIEIGTGTGIGTGKETISK